MNIYGLSKLYRSFAKAWVRIYLEGIFIVSDKVVYAFTGLRRSDELDVPLEIHHDILVDNNTATLPDCLSCCHLLLLPR